MIGLSPRTYGMTLQQTHTSKAVSEALPDLPVTVSDLISEMAVPDYSLAAEALQLDEEGEVVQSSRNLHIVSHIELALTAPSFECDPAIKSAIFFNANELVEPSSTFGRLRPYMAKILNDLKARDLQVNLDDVVIKDTVMFFSNGIDLGGMSAKRARFENMNMDRLELSGADLTGATFVDVSLIKANLSKAQVIGTSFFGVYFRDTLACGLTGNQTAIFWGSHVQLPDGESVRQIAGKHLFGNAITAIPDRSPFTISAEIQDSPMAENSQ